MRHIDSIVVTPEMRAAVAGLVDRLGAVVPLADPTWAPLVQALGLDGGHPPTEGAAVLVVGSPAGVLKHASVARTEFGFVVPVAQMTRAWQRAPSWRDETMLDLWRSGWTPVAIDRVITAKRGAGIEFAIGNARPTPH